VDARKFTLYSETALESVIEHLDTFLNMDDGEQIFQVDSIYCRKYYGNAKIIVFNSDTSLNIEAE
jgi:ABC-type uncharacterized transport system ATPase subunit